MVTYAVVEFEDTAVSIVRLEWLHNGMKESYWPRKPVYKKALLQPDFPLDAVENWESYAVVRTFKVTGEYR